MASPTLSLEPLTFAVYVAEYDRGELGVKVAVSVELLYATLADTDSPILFVSVKTIVEACTGSLNVAEITDVIETAVAPGSGDCMVTSGGAGSVVKDQVNGDDM